MALNKITQAREDELFHQVKVIIIELAETSLRDSDRELSNGKFVQAVYDAQITTDPAELFLVGTMVAYVLRTVELQREMRENKTPYKKEDMLNGRTGIYLLEVEDGMTDCQVQGNDRDLGVIVTSFLVGQPRMLKIFHESVHIAREMVEQAEAGKIDITKMIKIIQKKKGDM
jgi:hypothetical protein